MPLSTDHLIDENSHLLKYNRTLELKIDRLIRERGDMDKRMDALEKKVTALESAKWQRIGE